MMHPHDIRELLIDNRYDATRKLISCSFNYHYYQVSRQTAVWSISAMLYDIETTILENIT